MTVIVAGIVFSVIGVCLIVNLGGMSDWLGEYGRRRHEEMGWAAPGMTSGDQLRTAGWAMVLVMAPVCFVVGIIIMTR